MILDSINNPKDVKKLNLIEQKQLASELRDTIIMLKGGKPIN